MISAHVKSCKMLIVFASNYIDVNYFYHHANATEIQVKWQTTECSYKSKLHSFSRTWL